MPVGTGASASIYLTADEYVEPLTSREVLGQYP